MTGASRLARKSKTTKSTACLQPAEVKRKSSSSSFVASSREKGLLAISTLGLNGQRASHSKTRAAMKILSIQIQHIQPAQGGASSAVAIAAAQDLSSFSFYQRGT